MYERSAIVLEKNFSTILGLDQKVNLKTIYKDYKEITEEIQKYQLIINEEDNIINDFDKTANEIRSIQQEQKKLYKSNLKLEEERNQLFDNLDEESEIIERKLTKIENTISENNDKLIELRKKYVNSIAEFAQKQIDRNMCSRNRRTEEKKHLQLIEKITNDLNDIDKETLKNVKNFINLDNEDEKREIVETMINNGKDERIPFNKDVIENAVRVRDEIAKKEAECFVTIYERTRRLIAEINNDDIKLEKYKKALRDTSVKLAFLKAEKLYIVSFLDNERITAINGLKAHKQLMEESCNNFQADMEQFNKLYDLILREISSKSSKKAYRELYNKEYLKNIEEKEKSFEKEINNIKIHSGAIINSNYWRIEEIKNIYHVFQNEVTEKFGKDLSEFQLEEHEEEVIPVEKTEPEDDIFKTEISDDDVEYVDEFEYEDDDEYDDEYDNEYDDSEEDYDEEAEDQYDDEEEYDNDEYEDGENDDYYDEYDDDDEYDNDEEYDNEDDNYEHDYDDSDDEDDEDYYYDDEDEIEDNEYDDDDEENDEYDEYDDEEDEYDEDEYEDDEIDENEYEEDDEEVDEDEKPKKHNNKNIKQQKVKHYEKDIKSTRKTQNIQKNSSAKKDDKKGKGLFNKFFR